jgi:zinc transporter ZupT
VWLSVPPQGYAVLRGQDLDPMVYALMFGLVGGMMVYISLTELLPTALK